MPSKEINWFEPLTFAKKIADNYREKSWAFLYSGLNNEVKNSKSYIALFPKDELISDDFSKIKTSKEKWFGYLSYELGRQFEKLPKTKKSYINLPKIWLINYSLILEFDHDKKIITAIFSDNKKLDEILNYKDLSNSEIIEIKKIKSNFSDKSYLKTITSIKKMIAKGDFYQTNLTRKFFGKFSKKHNQKTAFDLFFRLTKLSPANYSSFLKLDENYIISSSPELFLEIENKNILSRPIKGTAPRGSGFAEDERNKLILQNSAKERAENLMIVDLVRNDLSRICVAQSVLVQKLFDITSYKNIHHMSSEIYGVIDKKYNYLDAVKSCFPAGSMTGAPKIKAMEIAAKKEKINRGVYSGAIGYLSESKTNLSVVIRTLILQKDKFEFQVGGAITFDSEPLAELAEIFSKAKAINCALDSVVTRLKT